MAYENITLRKQNVTMIDGYFYMMDESQDAMIVKTDDGTQAYSYPLDSTISNQVVSMEWDGRNFWTLENPSGDNAYIKRWNLENYVLKLRTPFDLIANAAHKYDTEAMAIEHYHLHFHSSVSTPTSVISMYQPKTKQSDFDLVAKLISGSVISLGPNINGQTEDIGISSVSVQTFGSTETIYNVNLNGSTTYEYSGPTVTGTDQPDNIRYGDYATFYNNIWLFNNWDGVSSADGALYKLNAYNGAYQDHYPGGEYKNVRACAFFDVPNYIFDRDWQRIETDPLDEPASRWPKFNSIAYVRTTNMIFLNPDNFDESFGSMTMDNVDEDQATVIPIFDLTMEGVNVYRLQNKATYYGTTYSFAGGTFNYQLSTLEPFITSISLRANPAILPANNTNTSQITAIVKDQFNLAIEGKLVYFTADDPIGGIIGANPATTDGDGVALTTYRAGTSAREVKITATAQQGGVETPTD
jgi:hypothetical protein